MTGMYGADVAQLRAAAAQFDAAADQLEADRMSVGNAIQISAWAGPFAASFRFQWASEHSQRIASAASLLRNGARQLRQNADGQEQASAVDGGALALAIPVGASIAAGGGLVSGIAALWNGAKTVHKVYSIGTLPADLAKSATALGFLAKNVRGATWRSVEMALQFSKGYKTVDAAADIIGGGKIVGRAFGVAGVAFDAVDLVSKASKGDVGGAIGAGLKAALGVASMVPGPVGLVATGVSVGIALYDNREQIAAAAQFTAKVATQAASEVSHTVSRVAEAAGRAASGFANGVAKAAKSLWPF